MRAFSFFESLKSLDVPKPRSTQPTRYRTRVKWVTGPGRAIGLYDAGHKVVDLNDCQVITTAASHHMHTARIHFSKLNPSAIDLRECQTSGSGVTRASAYLLTVVIATSDWPKAKKLATELAASYRTKHREVVGIAVNLRDASSVQMLGPVTHLLAGEAEAFDTVGLSTVVATFGSFVQANRKETAAIHTWIRDHLAVDSEFLSGKRPLGTSRRMLDLFSGSGSIGLVLAKEGHDVTCVDSYAPGVQRIQTAASNAKLKVSTFVADCTRDVFRTLGNAWDTIIVNPPRRGLSPRLREGIARSEAKQVVYVSCSPETLARDLEALVLLGFQIDAVQTFDMIPLTREVETAVLLSRQDSVKAALPLANSPITSAIIVVGIVGKDTAPLEDLGSIHSVTSLEHHSIVTFQTTIGTDLRKRISSRRVKILGDPNFGDPKTNAYLLEKYGLDRAYYDILAATYTSGEELTKPLASNLQLFHYVVETLPILHVLNQAT